LRDGIQSANPLNYPTNLKLKLLQEICDQYNPPKMEIGSFVSPKVLPIMADTASIFHHLRKNHISEIKYESPITLSEVSQAVDRKLIQSVEATTANKPAIYALIPNKTVLY
jgi:hypothetical protein